MKISNTSLRIKDECLIFTTAKICSNVNKLTRQKKRNQNLPLTQTLKHRLSSTCHCEFFISVFSVSREGGWEFHPFLRAALPTLMSLRSPTQTLGYLHGLLRKQDTGKHSPKSSTMSATLWWRKNMICIPGSKHVTYRLCPDFASNQTATKKRGWHRFHCWTFVLFHLVGLQNFHFVQMDICAQWQRLFHVFRWRAFCVSDVSVWRLIPVLWYTGYRYNTYTWYVI